MTHPAVAAEVPLDRAALRQQSSWRHGVTHQIANTDIDALLSAALMASLKGWQIAGFYDTQHLWITEVGADLVRDAPSRVAWVDLDMCWPALQSVGQHVVLHEPRDRASIDAFASTLNPSLAGGHSLLSRYSTKYPFGTFQFLWWLAGLPPPQAGDKVLNGLFWMPDGGFQSANNRWADNCRAWAVHRMELSPMSTLYDMGRVGSAAACVAAAEAAIRRLAPKSNEPGRWENMQYGFCRVRGGCANVLIDPSTPSGRAEVSEVLNAVHVLLSLGENPPAAPFGLRRYDGSWRCTDSKRPPPGWPASAGVRSLVSVAAISMTKMAYTTPTSGHGGAQLVDVLPMARRR